MFPTRDGHNTGALVMGDGYVPSREGALVYLNATGCLDDMLARAEAAGASVLLPRTFLSEEAGEAAILLDTEGNRIGLQSPVEQAAKNPEGEAATEPVTDRTMQAMLGAAVPQVAFLLKRGASYDDPASAPLQWEHARNMFTLMRDGQLSHVSALMDGTDALGFGLMMVASKDEAEAILREDPAVRGGRLAVELLSSISFDGERTRSSLQ